MIAIASVCSRRPRSWLLSALGRVPARDIAVEALRSGGHLGRLGVSVRDRRHGELAAVGRAVSGLVVRLTHEVR